MGRLNDNAPEGELAVMVAWFLTEACQDAGLRDKLAAACRARGLSGRLVDELNEDARALVLPPGDNVRLATIYRGGFRIRVQMED